MDKENLAWAAGLFEGEGSFSFCNKNSSRGYPTRGVKACLGMTDEEIVHRFQEIMGVGKVYGPYNHKPYKRIENRKPHWNWSASSFEHVQATVVFLWPWLGERRRQAATTMLQRYHAHPMKKDTRRNTLN
jgi:hypothetical protein